MFRYLLATYMLLLSLAGPSPCCCALARVVNVAITWAASDDNQSVPWPSCCPEQLTTDTDDLPDETPSGSPLSGSKGSSQRCKCEMSWCAAVPSPSSEVTIELDRSRLENLFALLATPLMLDVGNTRATGMRSDWASPPTLSGRAIRVAFHSWLC